VKKTQVKSLDVAKRLLDYGLHAPTVYFPLIVHEAMMIEPTETESKQSLDTFINAMEKIYNEAIENPEIVKECTTRHTSQKVGRYNCDKITDFQIQEIRVQAKK